ncbi:MAG: TlpA family protein disulfide reductase [Myxococcaceae bacterium]
MKAAVVVLALLLGACQPGPWAGPRAVPTPDRQHQPTLSVYFATWCFPCLAHLEVVRALHSERKDTVAFEAAGVDLEGDIVLVPFAEHARLPFPVRAARPEERPKSLPTTVLRDPTGRVRLEFSGVVSKADLRQAMDRALSP